MSELFLGCAFPSAGTVENLTSKFPWIKAGTWLSILNHFPASDPASLDQGNHWTPDPPAKGRGFTSVQMVRAHRHFQATLSRTADSHTALSHAQLIHT